VVIIIFSILVALALGFYFWHSNRPR